MVDIKFSVGKGCRNDPADVFPVQILLNKFIVAGALPGTILTQDGVAGKMTKGTIKAFQATFLGYKNPDGRVYPGGPTITALNGTVDQPKKGDPHDLVAKALVKVLTSSTMQKVRFRLGSNQIGAKEYKEVAKLIDWRHIVATYMPALGENAQYLHSNSVGASGMILVGFPTAATSRQRSIVVHEATHAICDGWGQTMSTVESEALAHLAQAIYYYAETGKILSYSYKITNEVLEVAGDIAIRMKLEGKDVVERNEISKLYTKVMKLPSAPFGSVFAYDGF